MGSTFTGLSVATSGLFSNRRAIEVTGHNVANANTPGYSRQRLQLGAQAGGSLGLHTGNSYGGGGVEILQQQRIVDDFIINRLNTETSQLGYATQLQQAYNRIELAFDEPGERGLAAQMEAFWDAWDAVAATPEDEAARSALLERAESIGGTFAGVDRQLELVAEDALQRAGAMAVDINGLASQIADMNVAIKAASAGQSPANDLLDQRDQLVNQLSTYVDVRTNIHPDGQMDVSIGGHNLVSGTRAIGVTLDTSQPGAAVLLTGNSTVPIRLGSGELTGLLEAANSVIPNARAALDAVAVQLRDAVNAQHALGQDLDGNPGTPFFSATGAADFGLDPAVAGQPRAVAAALLGAGAFDGENALRMAELAGLDGGPDDVYRAMVADLGVKAQTSNRRLELQTDLTANVQRSRDEVSGVSLDEEMTNMVAFQQAYQASARVITAVDEMLSVLIGMV